MPIPERLWFAWTLCLLLDKLVIQGNGTGMIGQTRLSAGDEAVKLTALAEQSWMENRKKIQYTLQSSFSHNHICDDPVNTICSNFQTVTPKTEKDLPKYMWVQRVLWESVLRPRFSKVLCKTDLLIIKPQWKQISSLSLPYHCDLFSNMLTEGHNYYQGTR